MAEDKTGLYIVTIVSIAAIVGLVTLYLNSGIAFSLGDANLAGQATMVEYGGLDKNDIFPGGYKIASSKDGIASGGTIVESGTKDISASKDEISISKGFSGDGIASGGTIVESRTKEISGIVCETC